MDASVTADGKEAVLRIEDNGVGITWSDLPHVFESSYRGAAARRINASGSGLGLPIARWVVERHGGSIRIESRPSQGTLVTVRMPLVRSGHHVFHGRDPLIGRAAVR